MGWEEGCGWAGGETARGGLGELRMWGWGTVEEIRVGWMDGWMEILVLRGLGDRRMR